MQEILQIKNGNITISSNGTRDYNDTLTNFKIDSGIDLSGIDFVLYNRTDRVLIKDGEIVDYVMESKYDNVINNLKNINEKKDNRLFKPLTPQEVKANDFKQKKESIMAAFNTANIMNNQNAMNKAREDYKALLANYATVTRSV